MASGAAPHLVAIVGSAMVGLAVGSFLNVVAYRVPRHLSVVRPASHCPSCRTALTARDTVPVVSWLVLGGRCRHCRAPVSARYPLVEAATGACFAAVAAALGGIDPLPSLALVVACALAAALVDGEAVPVPPAVAVVGALAALSLVVVAIVVGQEGRIGWAVLGAALCGAAVVGADRSWPPPRDAAVLTMAAPAAAGRWVVVAALGAAAGWLWLPGGPIAAAWVVASAVGCRLLPGAGARWTAPLWALGGGLFAVVLVAAALG